MAVNTFDSHISDLGGRLQELMTVIDKLEGLLKTHNFNDYISLDAADYTDRQVTKAQYDAAMVTVTDLLNTWLPAGHGTNIDGYLYEIP